jgi:hypothetical protein
LWTDRYNRPEGGQSTDFGGWRGASSVSPAIRIGDQLLGNWIVMQSIALVDAQPGICPAAGAKTAELLGGYPVEQR